MNEKLYYLLGELKDNFTEKLLSEYLNCLENEVHDFIKDSKATQLFNGQNARFYEEMAKLFVNDLNESPELYFLNWDALIDFLNEESKNIFFSISIDLSEGTDAWDYINGIVKLEDDSPEIALFYFNRIDDYVVCYFKGYCYMCLENDENAIKQYLFFILNFEKITEKVSPDGVCLKHEAGVLIAKWNVYNDLGYLYNRTGDYETSKIYFEKGLEIFSIEDSYDIRTNSVSEYNDFLTWLNNYLSSLEKLNEIRTCIEVLEVAICKMPSSLYLKNRLEALKKEIGSRNNISNKIFSIKKPFNIGRFENTKLVAKEKALESLIIEQIKYGFNVFGKPLEVYQSDMIFGRQYYIASVNGFLDLLLIDKSTNVLYLVELKRNEAGVEVVHQIEKYIKGLSMEINEEIRGIICVHKPNNELIELVKTKTNIELHSYGFEFKKHE
ncbi:MAG: endonuclease NucS domain-containing protein [Bacteroidota bacterium]